MKSFLCAFLNNYFLLLLLSGFVSGSLFAQNALLKQVRAARTTSVSANYALFTTTTLHSTTDTSFVKGASVARMTLNPSELNRLEQEQKNFVQISIPITANQSLELELIPYIVFAPSFTVIDVSGQQVALAKGKYYHGIIKGDDQSMASISIIDGEIGGLVSWKKGNFNLVKENKSSLYTFYNERDLNKKPDFNCFTDDSQIKAMGQDLFSQESTTPNIACGSVGVYIEADNQTYINQGSSIPATTNYVLSIFSKVASLYANEGISIVISQLKVWNTSDPYVNSNNAGEVLSAFINNVNSNFDGHLAHLFSMRFLGGGVANIDVLCNKSVAHAVTGNLEYNIPDLPNYSWSITIVAHELGHNFGSPHTHNCSWPGGAIDNCVGVEGNCSPGPAPVNGGTIMSYCYQTSYGTNLSNGFGTLPGNLIRRRTMKCLGSSASPTHLHSTEVFGTQAMLTWTHPIGMYSVDYRVASSENWISLGTTDAKHISLTSLTPNTAYEWRVKSDCSEYVSATFTTNDKPVLPAYCMTTYVFGCENGFHMTDVIIDSLALSTTSGCAVGPNEIFTYPILTVLKGKSYSFTVHLESYRNRFAHIILWIDFNQDRQFQLEEKVNSSVYTNTDRPLTGTFSIPLGVVSGETRMRFMLYNSSVEANACDSFSYGETEDYIITVATPCDLPISLTSPTDDYSDGTVVKQTNATIMAANKIYPMANVTYKAGASVTLTSGFQVATGASFNAQVGGCN